MKIFIIVLLCLITLVSANNITDEKFVCDKIFYFLIDNQNLTQDKLDTLLIQINEKENITNQTLNNYFFNYSKICPPINQKNLPFKFKIPTMETKNQTICDYEMKYTLFGDSSVLKASIPIFSYIMNNPSCEDVEKWRWIFGIEKVDTQYKINGIRVYFVLSLTFLIVMVIFLKNNMQVNRLAKQVLQS